MLACLAPVPSLLKMGKSWAPSCQLSFFFFKRQEKEKKKALEERIAGHFSKLASLSIPTRGTQTLVQRQFCT